VVSALLERAYEFSRFVRRNAAADSQNDAHGRTYSA
jgi:hypothetical protein